MLDYGRLVLPALLAAAPLASAHQLFVSEYMGSVLTLKYSPSNKTGTQDKLEQIQTVKGVCGTSPSWLTYHKHSNRLFCVNENTQGKTGSINVLSVGPKGELKNIGLGETFMGPVHAELFGGDACHPLGVAVANYGGSALQVFDPTTPEKGKKMKKLAELKFKLDKPGPVKESQTQSRPHSTTVDPTGQYLLVPDLGADLVRVIKWTVTKKGLELKELPGLKTPPGSGPRKVTFWVPAPARVAGHTPPFIYMYVVGELTGGHLNGYRVDYRPNGQGMTFKEVHHSDTVNGKKPAGIPAPSDITVLPGNGHLLVANRNDTLFNRPNPKNASAPFVFDSLTFYSFNKTKLAGRGGSVLDPKAKQKQSKRHEGHDDKQPKDTKQAAAAAAAPLPPSKDTQAALIFDNMSTAGGSFPRQFEVSPDGSKIAIALQKSSRIQVLGWDGDKGKIAGFQQIGRDDGFVATHESVLDGPVDRAQFTSVVWGPESDEH
ncbi:MAG: hypothetical protein M1831_004519 [Alyxoria varia]|nr:MAG: hypothetical protein M1831_004519 [Alyxoria varia]